MQRSLTFLGITFALAASALTAFVALRGKETPEQDLQPEHNRATEEVDTVDLSALRGNWTAAADIELKKHLQKGDLDPVRALDLLYFYIRWTEERDELVHGVANGAYDRALHIVAERAVGERDQTLLMTLVQHAQKAPETERHTAAIGLAMEIGRNEAAIDPLRQGMSEEEWAAVRNFVRTARERGGDLKQVQAGIAVIEAR
ncbi:MAG: hypothetical protein PF961_08980 [Planctomycetota bacterium]|jgi:hypothetical protein|nr:hypothetical protein [Planctomycetota bacterium]